GNDVNLTSSTTGGTSPYNFSWSGPNSFSSTDQNPTITSATTTESGTYNVTVTDGTNCTATATTLVTVNPLPTATAGGNTPVCNGNDLNLTSDGGTSYSWSGPNSFTSTDQNPTITAATTAATGTYVVIVTDGNNCSSTTSTDATVNPLPTAT